MRILLITPSPPLPLSIGGNQRTHLMVDALREIGSVDIFVIKEEEKLRRAAGEALWQNYSIVGSSSLVPAASRNWMGIFRRLSPALTDRLAHNLDASDSRFKPDPNIRERVAKVLERGNYNAVVCRYLRTVCQADLSGKLPLFVDVDDWDTSIYESRLAMTSSRWWQVWVLQRHLANIRKGIGNALRRCNWLWVSNPDDLNRIGPYKLSYLPNVPVNHPEPAPITHKAGRFSLLIVGSWGHAPNWHGLQHFITAIWPGILATIPSAVMRVVGSQLNSKHSRWLRDAPRVTSVGFVQDLAVEYAACDVVVAPIYYGGGTNIKVLEAIAYAKPCVLSPFAFRGYSHVIQRDEGVYVASADDEWARLLKSIHDNAAIARQASIEARRKALDYYTKERFRSRVVQDMRECIM